jgi:hypothetical protein
MTSSEEYDLNGIHGAEVFRDLPEGLSVQMSDGSVGRITANAGDGAWIMVEILEDQENPDRVGEVEATFFAEVKAVIGPSQEDGA